MFINFFRDGGILLEEQPVGDRSVELRVDERAGKTLRALLALESLECSHPLAMLWLCGVTAGERAVAVGRRAGKHPPPA